jgi:hypothetical protein
MFPQGEAEASRSVREMRTGDVMREAEGGGMWLSTLQMEGAMSQWLQATSGSWKRQGNGFSPRVYHKCTLPVLQSKITNVYCFRPLSSWWLLQQHWETDTEIRTLALRVHICDVVDHMDHSEWRMERNMALWEGWSAAQNVWKPKIRSG